MMEILAGFIAGYFTLCHIVSTWRTSFDPRYHYAGNQHPHGQRYTWVLRRSLFGKMRSIPAPADSGVIRVRRHRQIKRPLLPDDVLAFMAPLYEFVRFRRWVRLVCLAAVLGAGLCVRWETAEPEAASGNISADRPAVLTWDDQSQADKGLIDNLWARVGRLRPTVNMHRLCEELVGWVVVGFLVVGCLRSLTGLYLAIQIPSRMHVYRAGSRFWKFLTFRPHLPPDPRTEC